MEMFKSKLSALKQQGAQPQVQMHIEVHTDSKSKHLLLEEKMQNKAKMIQLTNPQMCVDAGIAGCAC
jgi:hypothetical protein